MSAVLQPSDPPAQFVDGELAYTDEGSGAFTVLAVPGLPGSSRDFRWLAPALADRCRVIRIDPPGYGASPRRGWSGMSTAERAAAVRVVIERLDVAPVVLVGHSAGGAVVAHLAAHHPELVKACVMVSSTGPRPHFGRAPLQVLALLLRMPPVRGVLTPLVRRLYAAQGFPGYLSDDERMFALLDAAAFDFRDHRDNLAAMRRPTLVAWSMDDPIISASTFGQLADAVPAGPRLEFADGGHNPQKTHASGLADAIVAFVG
jgi:pimeloyl-ACP methyl ester carboxylesterase